MATGQATWCPAEGAPCTAVTGTLVVHVFATGEIARFDAEMRSADGTHIAFTNAEVTSFWCSLAAPRCG